MRPMIGGAIPLGWTTPAAVLPLLRHGAPNGVGNPLPRDYCRGNICNTVKKHR